MERYDAAGPAHELHFAESGRGHLRGQFFRTRESPHRTRQVGICRGVARDGAAQSRQNPPEIKSVKRAEYFSFRLRKFQDADFSTRPQHAANFLQPFIVIRQIAKSERGRHQIERRIRKRQMQRVRFDELDRTLRARAPRRRLATRQRQHRVREIRTGNSRRPTSRERKRQIARPAAQIKHT